MICAEWMCTATVRSVVLAGAIFNFHGSGRDDSYDGGWPWDTRIPPKGDVFLRRTSPGLARARGLCKWREDLLRAGLGGIININGHA